MAKKPATTKRKTMGQNYHVVPSGDGSWAVRRSGETRAKRLFDVKNLAIRDAVTYARDSKSGIIIHKIDGRIEATRNYSKSDRGSIRSKR